ncbi:MAG: hypothetical protein ABSA93_07205 [Streptosporangiaceae bacterium]|jgi:uncharacterized protein YgiM (DUF1202 family)
MINVRKAAATLCLSGFVIGGTATTAFAATASTSQATVTSETTATVQATQVVGYWCGYQVVRAPNGLYVRTGPSQGYRVVGSLRDGAWTTGSCAKWRGWVHLSNKYTHWTAPKSARGWSYGYYLQKPVTMSWCGYRVTSAPNGLYVRSGPGRGYWVIGSLANGQRTTGACGTVRGWVHLSDKYNHWHSPWNARGWSYRHYLSK